MKTHFIQVSRAALAAGVYAAALLLTCPGEARAQMAPSRRDERRADMESRQRALRSLSGLNAREAKKARAALPVYQQVAEDFQELQLSNYRLSGAAAAGAPLDYARVVEEASEVRRRASRLRAALALPAVKKEQKRSEGKGALTPEGVKAAVALLDALVNSFVWNPVFRKPDVLDVENSTKAGRELDEILRLSEQIKGAAEALGKGKTS